MLFDGKSEAEKIRNELLASGKLNGKSLLIVQADGRTEESTYVRLKREAGEGLGVRVKVEFFQSKEKVAARLGKKIDENGVLVQLPIIGADRIETQKILDMVPEGKDVDGLSTFSRFLPAVVKAVDRALVFAWGAANLRFAKAAVVGAEGMMGRRLVKWLEERALEVDRFDMGSDLSLLVNYDVVIGATGSASLIKSDMVKRGVVAVDLGYPRGDFAPEVRSKAGLVTPVPGGIGPVTIMSLFENLAQV